MSHTTYCEEVAAADERHRVRVTEAGLGRDAAVQLAFLAYQRADPCMGRADANVVYRKAVADAEFLFAEIMAESARIASDRDAAWAEYITRRN